MSKFTRELNKMLREPKKELSKAELGINFVHAMGRAAKQGFRSVSKGIYAERNICCTTCGNGKMCPYCGCKKSWKSWLASEETCPNPITYPKIHKYPPRNYWEVCGELVSVIIPSRNDPYLERTIQSVQENAAGPIEVIVAMDGTEDGDIKEADGLKVIRAEEAVGKRAIVNTAAKIAKGKYLFIIDAHCTMSYGWDTKMKCACGENDLVHCRIQALNLETFELVPGHIYSHVYLDNKLIEKWWSKEPLDKIEEAMCFTGCGWMIQKDRYWSLGGYSDLELGQFGYEGPEWALKVQLDNERPGKLFLRTDVICGHIFGTNTKNNLYQPQMMPHDEYYQYMMDKYGAQIPTLVERFWPVPTWDKPNRIVLEYSEIAFCGFSQVAETKSA